MNSDEKWRRAVSDHPEKYDWLGSARHVIERGSDRMWDVVERGYPDTGQPPTVPVPKPGRRTTDLFHNGSSGRDKCARERLCRMCQRSVGDIPEGIAIRQITRHHMVPLRWFNTPRGGNFRPVRNANANIVPLCWPCHKQIEDRDMIARRMLRALLSQKEIAYAARTIGMAWLDREYPLR